MRRVKENISQLHKTVDSLVVGVFDRQLVAPDPLVMVRFISLHPVSRDGASSVLIRLVPGQTHRIFCHI